MVEPAFHLPQTDTEQLAKRREDKRTAFKRLAEKRTTAALERIRVLGNLANRSAYEYTDDDVRKIFSALRREIRKVESSFAPADKKEFRLD